MTEINLIDTDTLVEELKSRFDVFVVIGVRSKTEKDSDTYYNNYRGGISNCMGLTQLMQFILERDYFGNRKELEEL